MLPNIPCDSDVFIVQGFLFGLKVLLVNNLGRFRNALSVVERKGSEQE